MALAMPSSLNDELRRGFARSVWPGSGFQGGGTERERERNRERGIRESIGRKREIERESRRERHKE